MCTPSNTHNPSTCVPIVTYAHPKKHVTVTFVPVLLQPQNHTQAHKHQITLHPQAQSMTFNRSTSFGWPVPGVCGGVVTHCSFNFHLPDDSWYQDFLARCWSFANLSLVMLVSSTHSVRLSLLCIMDAIFLPDMGIADAPLCPCFFDFLSGVSGAGISHCDEVQSITYNHFGSPKGINLHAPKVSRFPPVFASRTFQRLTFHLCVREFQQKLVRGAGWVKVRLLGGLDVQLFPHYLMQDSPISQGIGLAPAQGGLTDHWGVIYFWTLFSFELISMSKNLSQLNV